MRIYDITRTVQDAPVYPGDEAVAFNTLSSIANGDACNHSAVCGSVHAGTHADAFSHFKAEGETIDKMSLEHYFGKCRIITVPSDTLVKLSDIQGRLAGSERIVLRSGGTSTLCEQAAEYLAACGIRAVATDAVSIAPFDNEHSIHSILTEGGVAIIENVCLDEVPDGDYLLFALPVKYGGADGAPVRAVLIGE